MSESGAENKPVASVADLVPKMRLEGIVKETLLQGAVVDLGLEVDGLVHISQLSPTRVNRVTDVVKPGDRVTVWVTKVSPDGGSIGLTMVEPPAVEWQDLSEGQVRRGVVVRLEPYGAFVNIGAERPGLLHVREMSTGYVRHPSEMLKIGDEVEVRILKYDRRKRRIDLSMLGITPEEAEGEEAADADNQPALTPMQIALQRARSRSGNRESPRVARQTSRDLAEREAILSRTLEQHRKR